MQENSHNIRYLSFSLGNEEYAIPLLVVKEVIAIPEVTPIPFTPNYFLGLMNLRGQVISVLDLRTKLGIKPSTSAENAVIICDLDPISLGVIVDSINSVVSPDENELSGRPDTQNAKASEYITNIYRKNEKLILIINLAKALSIDDYKAISGSEKAKEAA